MVARALGLVALGRGDTTGGIHHLQGAVRQAEGAGLDHRAGEARMSLAFALFMAGDTAAALREMDDAAPALSGVAAARLQTQRASILSRLGRSDEALEGYASALAVFRRVGDRLWEGKLRQNRGWLHAYRGDWRSSTIDLERAEQLAAELGNESAAAQAVHSRGFLAALRGDIPTALACFDRAEERYREAGYYLGQLLLDRAEVLLAVGLREEARQAAAAAVTETQRQGVEADLAEARLMLARAALLQGDLAVALSSAEEARRAFLRQRRKPWAVLARFVALRAAWEGGRTSAVVLRAARQSARALAEAGWSAQSLEARLIAARIALARGQGVIAQRELALASAARRGPVDLRARVWHAEALRWLAAGDRRSAFRALRSGLRVIEDFQATLGATELRSQAAGLGEELAETGLRLALSSGRAGMVLGWAERWRARVLRMPRVRPPDDPVLADNLTQLRRVVRELEEASLSGGETAALVRRQIVLEQSVRRRARHAAGGRSGQTGPPLAELQSTLGERALLELVDLDDRLHAVVVAGRRVRLHELADRKAVLSELAAVRFALARLAHGRGSTRGLRAARATLAASAARLDDLLLRPCREELGDRQVVVVPTGPLHALPWSALPSLSGRPLVVAPSAAWWQRVACSQDGGEGRTVFVAGPGLEHAEAEVRQASERYPESACLTGNAVTAQAVIEAIDGAGLAHIAAHGRFRADNPLFSRLDLADGPLTVYDLERLVQAPETLVLSACESGLSDVQPGDELMGLAAALFALGTRTVVASVAPVADDASRSLTLAFHAGLLAGSSPAEALAAAQAVVRDDGDEGLATAAAFVCFGAG
jgi:CHAT domain-containing protein/Tfp pilus assembly protein PilF